MRTPIASPRLVDAAFVLVLGAIALAGFRDTYGGWQYLTVGVVGLLLGAALAELSRALGQPIVVLVALVVGAYFVLGGVVAFHDIGGANLLPVPHTLSRLARTAVHGWKDLLTTLPPVDNGPLLVLPYLIGLVTGAIGTAVANRFRAAPAPVLVPLAALSVVILFGVKDVRHTVVVAAAFALLTVLWLVVRETRSRNLAGSGVRRRYSRRLAGAVLALGAASLAIVAGPRLPGLSHDRIVLRSKVVPPFNVGQYPSPLAGFRRFTAGYKTVQPANALYDRALFRVNGLPAGTPVRIATLDSYDGTVWGAGDVAGTVVDPQTADSDTFQRVGRVIAGDHQGTRVNASVEILEGTTRPGSSPLNVWLPTAGDLTGITFANPDTAKRADSFRYNLASGTGVLPQGLARGDSYSFTAVIPNSHLGAKTQLASGGLPEVESDSFQQLAATWGGKTSSTLAQVRAIALYLKSNGHYTDGGSGYQTFPSGQSLYRLKLFTSTQGQLAGDDEQFAAMMALTANAVGVPARVVVGAVPEADGVVKGKDVHAWVELQATDGSWRTLPWRDFLSLRKPQKQQQENQHSVAASTIPPPAPVHPPASAGEPLENSLHHKAISTHDSFLHLPAFVIAILKYGVLPLALLALCCASIVFGKSLRRSRRRSRGSTQRRLAYAWTDLLESARDFGIATPTGRTRKEQAAALVAYGLTGYGLTERARRADSLMFGRAEPTDDDVAEFWSEVDRFRQSLESDHTRWERVRAKLSLVTFRPPSPAPLRRLIPTFRTTRVEATP